MESGGWDEFERHFSVQNGGNFGSHNTEKADDKMGNIIRRIMLTNVTILLDIVSKNEKIPDIWGGGWHKLKFQKMQKVVDFVTLNWKAWLFEIICYNGYKFLL